MGSALTSPIDHRDVSLGQKGFTERNSPYPQEDVVTNPNPCRPAPGNKKPVLMSTQGEFVESDFADLWLRHGNVCRWNQIPNNRLLWFSCLPDRAPLEEHEEFLNLAEELAPKNHGALRFSPTTSLSAEYYSVAR